MLLGKKGQEHKRLDLAVEGSVWCAHVLWGMKWISQVWADVHGTEPGGDTEVQGRVMPHWLVCQFASSQPWKRLSCSHHHISGTPSLFLEHLVNPLRKKSFLCCSWHGSLAVIFILVTLFSSKPDWPMTQEGATSFALPERTSGQQPLGSPSLWCSEGPACYFKLSGGCTDILSKSNIFLDGTSDEEPARQWGRLKRCRLNPWVGKVPWRREWQPTPVFLPGKSHGQRSLAGYGITKSWTQLSTHSRFDYYLDPIFSPPENSCVCYVSSNCFLKAVHSLSFCSLILLLDPPPPGFQTSLYPQQSQDLRPCVRVTLRISRGEWKSSPVQVFRASSCFSHGWYHHVACIMSPYTSFPP